MPKKSGLPRRQARPKTNRTTKLLPSSPTSVQPRQKMSSGGGRVFQKAPEGTELIAAVFPNVLERMEARREHIRHVRNEGGKNGNRGKTSRLIGLAYHEDREDIKQGIIEAMETLIVPGLLGPPPGPTQVPVEVTKARYTDFFLRLSEGAALHSAIAISGIPRRRFIEWMGRGGDPGYNKGEDTTDIAPEPYRTFALNVRAVQAMYNHTLVEKISKAAASDWKAGAWLLERRDPESYGTPKNDVKVGVQAGGNTQVHIYVPSNGREAESDLAGDSGAAAPTNPADDIPEAVFWNRTEGGGE